MKWYKYIKKKNLDSFFSRGTLRIGTLYDFRKAEKYNSAIGDPHEATLFSTMKFQANQEIKLAGSSPEADFINRYFGPKGQAPKDVTVRFVSSGKMTAPFQCNNLYIFCVSSKFDLKLMEEFECDACFEIINPVGFFQAITHKIRHQASFDQACKIRYVETSRDFCTPHEQDPAVIKKPEFEYQAEVRAIWTPRRATVEPILVDVPKAIKYCKIVNF